MKNDIQKYSLKNLFHNLHQIWILLSDYKFKVICSIILSVTVLILNLIIPIFILNITNILFYGLNNIINNSGEISYNMLFYNIINVGIIYLLRFVFDIIKNLISTNTSKLICDQLRNELFSKINLLPFSYFEKSTKGDFLSRLINDVDRLGEQITETFTSIVTLILSVILSLIMMFLLSAILTSICIIIIPLTIIFTTIITKKSQPYFLKQQESIGSLNGIIEEQIRGFSLIQVFSKQNSSANEFNNANEEWYKKSYKAQVISQLTNPLFGFLNRLSYIVVIVVGAFLCIVGTFSVGGIIAFNQYLTQFSNPLSEIINTFTNVQSIAASCQRVHEILEYPEDKNETCNNLNVLDINKNINDSLINFESINFSYNNSDYVLKNFDLQINKGETIAIVGATGSGKTTVIKLLLKFYNNYEGKIKINGNDIKKISNFDVRNLFAVVLQDVWLFKGSIYDNVKYGNQNSNREAIIKALKITKADKFINNLPYKYEFEISENASNLSNGQRQLISIARAIVADKPILILDEATSSVDTHTEKQVFEAFDSIMENKTAIVIAHRLSTIKKADKIIVLNNSQIVETGTHKKLMAKNGYYYKLIKASNE